ncbi:DUF2059 domain-containing protein [Pelagicoccus sp. SDUM812005]|uniref:DUF2059 domain-containing protein n=1 Tax=Pelagicoccus sp. SDUM812005 TaxID=3041257 RepID=UPI00280FEDC0|nr:DUF2059 domain-containing protein [Pelagicoccus sp. SDUM812005]MDQ8181692.1 DUF2059 domain-containing protein [Pelagicoccus sp. SDUM812005]
MTRASLLILLVSHFVTNFSFAEIRETARLVVQSTGMIEAKLNMPWQHWQNLTDEQRLTFEHECQYNQALLEADLVDYLVKEFTDEELNAILSFNMSEVGRKWLASTGPKGGFNVPPLNESATDWVNARRSEARSYVTAILTDAKWTTPFYKGIVGGRTTSPELVYNGEYALSVFGFGEAAFTRIFGSPVERMELETEGRSFTVLKGDWAGYHYDALFIEDELTKIALIRLPDENATYVEKMRTQLSDAEIEALMKGFSNNRKWTKYESKSVSGDAYFLEDNKLYCTHSGYRILFDTSSSFGRSPGP